MLSHEIYVITSHITGQHNLKYLIPRNIKPPTESMNTLGKKKERTSADQ